MFGRVSRPILILAILLVVGGHAFATGGQEQAGDDDGGITTINVRSVGAGEDWDLSTTEVGSVLVEKTGVNVTMTHGIGDENEQIALMIASGDFPDAVHPRYRLGPFVDAGVAMEITDLVEENAPNMLEAYGPMWDRMRYSPEDPGRYYFGHYFNGEAPEVDPFPGDWFLLQHHVRMDQGYPELDTLEQLGDALRAYKEKYPTIDGQPTVGISFHLGIWVLNLHNPAMVSGGLTAGNNFLVEEDGTVTMHRRLPEHKPFYRWMNQMYNEGLVDPEAFTQTKDQFEAKAASGRVLTFLGMGWQVGQVEQILNGDGKSERTYGAVPVAAEGMLNAYRTRGLGGLQTAQAELVIPTDTSEEKALAIVRLLDYVATDEGSILTNWGIEGVHYTVDNGTRVWTSETRERYLSDANFGTSSGIGLMDGAPFPHFAKWSVDSTGNFRYPDYNDDFRANYPDIDKEVLDGYGVQTWQDLFPPASEFDIPKGPNVQQLLNQLPSDHPARLAYVTINDLSQRDLVNAIIAPPDEFDGLYDRYLDNMVRSGIYDLEETATEITRERMRFWGVLD
jgi:putative aldouronate transport system substrate-binding protein